MNEPESIAYRHAPGAHLPGRTLDELVAVDAGMRAVIAQLRALADSPSPLWISGEMGVGKTVLAVATHRASRRADAPVVITALNAAFPRERERLCFGHRRLDGPECARGGALTSAPGGTSVLSNFNGVGSRLETRIVNAVRRGWFRSKDGVRMATPALIVTSFSPLSQSVENGLCIPDWRELVTEVRVPPLRARRADIAPLAALFLAENAALRPRASATLDDGTRRALCARDWPGNVHELWLALLSGMGTSMPPPPATPA